MWVATGTAQHDAVAEKTIFRFEVRLLSGPVTPSFMDEHPETPSRIIDIRGSQTLNALHLAIFKAFDRDDAHMYEFQIGGKNPMDRKAVRYSITAYGHSEEKDAKTTTISALNLKVGKPFFYWFDFGDDWWHEVCLLAVNPPKKGKGRYPRIVEKKGESPPQYADWEDEEEEEEEDASGR
ncbi:MAG: plasmid pRiA4b ORF-3 family protein [Desulfovibrio sp.]|nr:plasmid pRiA4b ORF-3 family protein [Desulfovibrio sp.]